MLENQCGLDQFGYVQYNVLKNQDAHVQSEPSVPPCLPTDPAAFQSECQVPSKSELSDRLNTPHFENSRLGLCPLGSIVHKGEAGASVGRREKGQPETTLFS